MSSIINYYLISAKVKFGVCCFITLSLIGCSNGGGGNESNTGLGSSSAAPPSGPSQIPLHYAQVSIESAPSANNIEPYYMLTGTCSTDPVSVTVKNAEVESQEVPCDLDGKWAANFDVAPIEFGKTSIQIYAAIQASPGVVPAIDFKNAPKYFIRPGSADPASFARFLMRSTFGISEVELNHVSETGYDYWIEEQIQMPPTYHLENLTQDFMDSGIFYDTASQKHTSSRRLVRMDHWWEAATNSADQLRQRMAFALSQILVVSDEDDELYRYTRGITRYYDLLIEHAFGNYRDLLKAVAVNPMMGNYLSMRRNEKANTAQNIRPDENFARELMQLFTIGLVELEIDGSPKLDSLGNEIPTYSQRDVMEFARVFTGWNYDYAYGFHANFGHYVDSEESSMIAYEEYHDTESKKLLDNVIVPAGLLAEQDLDAAIDNLFIHPNLGPFLAKRLISQFVTSNPSSQFIQRVAEIFNDNGQGVRGDLSAVIAAILLDDEAFSGGALSPETFGKLREPVIKLTSLWRSFGGTGSNGRLRFGTAERDFEQEPLGANSVFNFFSPLFSKSGEITAQNLLSPEFQILNETSAISYIDRMYGFVFSTDWGSEQYSYHNKINIDLSKEVALAESGSTSELVDRLDLLLTGMSLTSDAKQYLNQFAESIPMFAGGEQRVRELIYQIMISPTFSVQR